MTWLAPLVWYGARVCLVAMFPFSAIDKIVNWGPSLKQTDSAGIPGGKAMLVLAIVIEAVTPLCIVAGWYDRLGAVLLAGFCAVTAVLYHPFWRYPAFWSPRATAATSEHWWQFLKNFGLVGGLLLVVFAGSLAAPGQVLSGLFAPHA